MRIQARATSLALAAALLLLGAGCSKDKEVLSFVGDLDTFSAEIVKKVKTAANPSAGVDAAQAYLDQNKSSIKQKLAAIKEVRGFQISEDTKKKVETSLMNSASAVAGLELEYVGRMASNQAFRTKLEKLVGDYRNVLSD